MNLGKVAYFTSKHYMVFCMKFFVRSILRSIDSWKNLIFEFRNLLKSETAAPRIGAPRIGSRVEYISGFVEARASPFLFIFCSWANFGGGAGNLKAARAAT